MQQDSYPLSAITNALGIGDLSTISCNAECSFALQEMVDRSPIPKALVIADRGYESYHSMAHIQEKVGIIS